MTAVLYIEGGGDNRRLGAQFREGWTSFFTAAGLRGRMPGVVRGGTRQDTFNRFATDAAGQKPGTIPLLLVDSEDPVAAGHSAWQHLQQQDGWDRPSGAGDDQAFLMVQVMETWFLADHDALRSYFGPLFYRERAQAMAQVGRPVQGDGSRRVGQGHRPMPKPVFQGQDFIRIAGANRSNTRRSRMSAWQGSPEPIEGVLKGASAGPAG